MQAAAWAGATVYVIGGSQGIGLSAAKKVAARGANVLVCARRPDILDTACQEVRAAVSSDAQRVESRALDVRDHAQVRTVLEAAVADFGVPTVLLNCAGRAFPARFEDLTYDAFDDTMKVNLYGCWNTVSVLVPHMKTNGGGYIVNTSSIAGLIGVFGFTDYCASKFGIVGFSEALRSELKPHGFTVSVLCPPDTDTPGFARENQTKPPETHAISATAKLMTADAVADVLIDRMRRKPFLIVPGTDGRLSVLAKRFVPGLIERMMDGTIRKVQGRTA